MILDRVKIEYTVISVTVIKHIFLRRFLIFLQKTLNTRVYILNFGLYIIHFFAVIAKKRKIFE